MKNKTKNNLEKKCEKEAEARFDENLLIGVVSTIGFGAALLGSYLINDMNDLSETDKARVESYQTVHSILYEPVGNGGALAEMNGHISPKRKEMYEKLGKIRYELSGQVDSWDAYYRISGDVDRRR